MATAIEPITIVIRDVWADNLDFEFALINSVVDDYPFVSMDTEFPGVVYAQDVKNRSPEIHYSVLKSNVDMLNLIQIGLTMTDSSGNFPDLGSRKNRYIWQFNFRDFDVSRDLHKHDSIALLRTQGIDFEKNRMAGVDSVRFGELLMTSGLVCSREITWITFHGAYDFGYLIKVLTQRPLPERLSQFLELMSIFFKGGFYDVKYMGRFLDSLHGGLDRIAHILNLDRLVGKSHQAGSDSLLTWCVFKKILYTFFSDNGPEKYSGHIPRSGCIASRCLFKCHLPTHYYKQFRLA